MSFARKNLKNHPYSNCYVLESEGTLQFISYNTLVIQADRIYKTAYNVQCTGLYSRTTSMQMGWFIQEYFPTSSYQIIKSIAGTNKTIILERK